MPLTPGTNSFVTLDEAKAIVASRLQTGAWDAASTPEAQRDPLRERALEEAFWSLNYLDWLGWKKDPEQPAAWPRQGVPDPDADGWQGWRTYVPDDTTPDRVKRAQVELAVVLLETVSAGGESGESSVISGLTGLKKVKVGDIEVEAAETISLSSKRAASVDPLADQRVRDLLDPFLMVGANQFRLVP